MIRSTTAILVVLVGCAMLACHAGGAGVPLLPDLEVKIGSPPMLLLGQVEPVPDGNRARHSRLAELFTTAGCTRVEKRWMAASEFVRVTCTLEGATDRTILVSANFGEPVGGSHHDNWSGAAMLPSLYWSLQVAPRQHTYEFVAFADEGTGTGSDPAAAARMLRRLPDEERAHIVALVGLQGLALHLPSVWDRLAAPSLHLDLYSVSRSLDVPMRRVDFVRHTRDVQCSAVGNFDCHQTPSRRRVHAPYLHVPSILIGVADLQAGEYLDSFRLVAVYLSYLDQTLELRKQILEGGERRTADAQG